MLAAVRTCVHSPELVVVSVPTKLVDVHCHHVKLSMSIAVCSQQLDPQAAALEAAKRALAARQVCNNADLLSMPAQCWRHCLEQLFYLS